MKIIRKNRELKVLDTVLSKCAICNFGFDESKNKASIEFYDIRSFMGYIIVSIQIYVTFDVSCVILALFLDIYDHKFYQGPGQCYVLSIFVHLTTQRERLQLYTYIR